MLRGRDRGLRPWQIGKAAQAGKHHPERGNDRHPDAKHAPLPIARGGQLPERQPRVGTGFESEEQGTGVIGNGFEDRGLGRHEDMDK